MDSAIHDTLGNAYAQLGDTEAAAAQYELSATLDPQGALALGNLAAIHYGAGRIELALKYARLARLAEPSSMERYRAEADILRELGRNDEASALLAQSGSPSLR